MKEQYKISIVICTYRRFELLDMAVHSIIHQTANRNTFELLVVDNDIKENEEIIEITKQASKIINVRYIHENKLGLSQARNRGGQAANSLYVGYMDDDAKASDNYIETAITIIDFIKPDIFGGPYYPYYIDNKPKWFLDKYESIEKGEARLLTKNEFLNGTNILFKRSLLNDLGWFDTKLGMVGNKISYGEETSLQILAWNKNNNLKVYYTPKLVILHLVQLHKMSLSDKFKRSFKVGYSQTYLWLSSNIIIKEKRRAPLILIKILVLFFVKEPLSLLFRNRKVYTYWHNYAYERWPKYCKSLGQEWKLMKDLIKV